MGEIDILRTELDQAFGTAPPLFTHAERVVLLRSAVPDRLAWAAAVLREHPPQTVSLPPTNAAAVEALVARLADDPVEVQAVLGVGRAAAVVYRRRSWGLDPVIPIAFPLLRIPRYRSGVRALIRSQIGAQWGRWEWRDFRSLVEEAADALLRTAPGRLTVPEAAFALLGTMHLLSDPSGYALLRRLR